MYRMKSSCDLQGYDISFLITYSILEDYDREKIIGFIIDFMEGIDAEISAMKIGVNSRARSVASQFMRCFVQYSCVCQLKQIKKAKAQYT